MLPVATRGEGMRVCFEAQQNRGGRTDARTLKRVAKAFAPYAFQVIAVLTVIVLTTVLGLAYPLLISTVFDDAISG